MVANRFRGICDGLSASPSVRVCRPRGNNRAMTKGQRTPPPRYSSTITRTACCMITTFGSRSWLRMNRRRTTTTIALAKTTPTRTSSGKSWAAKSWSRSRRANSISGHGNRSSTVNLMVEGKSESWLRLSVSDFRLLIVSYSDGMRRLLIQELARKQQSARLGARFLQDYCEGATPQ